MAGTSPKLQPKRDKPVPAAKSGEGAADRRATPEEKIPYVSQEDEPRGYPTSDRFHSEQAHRKPGKA